MTTVDPAIHTVGHRNKLLIVRGHLDALTEAFERLTEHRRSNHEAVNAVRASRGEVDAQRVADTLKHDSALARELFEELSGTALGNLLRQYGLQHISEYPRYRPSAPTPPAAA